MNVWQSEQQVALQELTVAVQHSADHYRDAADILQDQQTAEAMAAIAARREQFTDDFYRAIRRLDELPSVPDRDMEAGEKLMNRVRAAFASDEVEAIIELRLQEERRLQELIEECRNKELPRSCLAVVDSLSHHVAVVIHQLKRLQAEH